MSVSVVCLYVCFRLSAIMSSELHVRSQPSFFMHVTSGAWLGPTLAGLRISGVMDDVIFAHKLRLVDVAARLRQRGSHAGLGLARRNTRCRQQTLGTTSSKTVVWFSLCAVNPTLMFGYIHTQAYIGLETFGIQGLGY